MSEILGPEGVNFFGKKGVNAADPIHDKDVVNLRSLRYYLDLYSASTISDLSGGTGTTYYIDSLGDGFPNYLGQTGTTFYFGSFSAGTNLGLTTGNTLIYYLQDNIYVSGLTASTIQVTSLSGNGNSLVLVDEFGNLIISGGTPFIYNILSAGTAIQIISGSSNITIRHTLWESGQTGTMSVQLQNANNRTTQDFGLTAGRFNTGSSIYSAILNGKFNVINSSSNYSFIGNGSLNTASTSFVSILNGLENRGSGAKSLIGNGFSNLASNTYSSIINGSGNTASGQRTFIGNGISNLASNTSVFIGNGSYNIASSTYSSVINGLRNTASSFSHATVLNGYHNNASGIYSFVGNGKYNTGSSHYSTILNGEYNLSSGAKSFIGNGFSNTALTTYSTVINGNYNQARAVNSIVGAGSFNKISLFNENSSILNGSANTITTNIGNSNFVTIINGIRNYIRGKPTGPFHPMSYLMHDTIINGYANTIYCGQFSLIGNGLYNITNNFFTNGYFEQTGTTILNGSGNTAQRNFSTILNGVSNFATDSYSLVGSGKFNSATTQNYSTVLNGLFNIATGRRSLILQGSGNTANTTCTTVANGRFNAALGTYSTVLNGINNLAQGTHSFISNGSNHQITTARSAIIGGQNYTASTYNDTVHVPDLLIWNIASGGTYMVTVDPDGKLFFQTIPAGSGTSSTFSATSVGIGTSLINAFSGQTLYLKSLSGGNLTDLRSFNNDTLIIDHTLFYPGAGTKSFILSGTTSQANSGFSISLGQSNTTNGLYSSILNGKNNSISANYSVIGGGSTNTITSTATTQTIAGGNQNSIKGTGSHNAILGGSTNIVSGTTGNTIGGGQDNLIEGTIEHAFIGGGNSNKIQRSSSEGIIVGGRLNVISATTYSFIGGGSLNIISAVTQNVIVAGTSNQIYGTASNAFVGGGITNRITVRGNQSSILGGNTNKIINRDNAVIAGGTTNIISGASYSTGSASFIGAGSFNKIYASGVIVGGSLNKIAKTNYFNAFIGAGQSNDNYSTCGAIVAGRLNRLGTSATSHSYGFIGAGISNFLMPIGTAGGGFIGAGNQNSGRTFSVIGSGSYNYAGGIRATTLNGIRNKTYSWYTSIFNGSGNTIAGSVQTSQFSTIGNGLRNTITSSRYCTIENGILNTIGTGRRYSTIVNGSGNSISTSHGIILGGLRNNISSSTSPYSTILNGTGNTISSTNSHSHSILGGHANTISSANTSHIAIISCEGVTADSPNSVYVPNLFMMSATTGGTHLVTFSPNSTKKVNYKALSGGTGTTISDDGSTITIYNPGMVVLINSDETDVSGTTTNTTAKSYALSSNSYQKIIIESEVTLSGQTNTINEVTFDIIVTGSTKESVVLRQEATGVGQYLRLAAPIKFSESCTGGGTLAISSTVNTGNGLWTVKSLRVFGVV